MIGRQKESATLHECLLRSKSEMSVVLIGGPAGIGETRLLDELDRLAGTQQIPTLRSAVAGVEHSLPYASICRIIEESLRLPNPPDISDLAPELTERFPLLRETPELRVHATPVARSAARMRSTSCSTAAGRRPILAYVWKSIASSNNMYMPSR